MRLIIAAVACLASLTPLAAAVNVSDFFAARSFSDGGQPYAVEGGDFDGDGKGDVLVNSPQFVTVYFGNGQGGFAAPLRLFNPNGETIFPRAADINNDGRTDIVLPRRNPTTFENSIAVYFGDASRAFAQVAYSAVSPQPESMVFADMDNDGALDIISLGCCQTGFVRLFKGTAGGNFTFINELSTGTSLRQIEALDFNGDNKLDLVLGTISGVEIMPNGGNFSFGARTVVDSIPQFFRSMVAGDVNGDGRKDLVIVNDNSINPQMRVLINNGNGTFAAALVSTMDSSETVFVNQITDIDGDGAADVLLTSKNRVIVRRGTGNGNFGAAESFYDGGRTAFARDMNGDGFKDIVTGQSAEFSVPGAGSFSVLKSLGGQFFQSAPAIEVTFGLKDMVVADVVGDSAKDIIFVSGGAGGGPGEIEVLVGGDELSKTAARSARPAGGEGIDLSAVATGDFNNDGKTDIIAVGSGAFGGPLNAVVLMNVDRTDFTANLFQIGTGGLSDVAVADVNGDGKADLVTVGGGVLVSFGTGTGTFAAPVTYLSGPGKNRAVLSDLNNDGKPDVAVNNFQSDIIQILLNNGSGTFTEGTSLNPTGDLNDLAAADMNGDGNKDLVAAKSNGVSVFTGAGNGAFAAPAHYTITPEAANRITVADLNGDGKPDVALAGSTNVLSILHNNGSGGLGSEVLWGAGVQLNVLTASDLDGDGNNDLILGISPTSSGRSIIKLMQNTTEPGTASAATPFDFDADGRSDLSIFRPSNSAWYIQRSSNNSFQIEVFGLPGDQLAPVDFDGDRRADVAIFRPSNGVWYILGSTGVFTGAQFGTNGDRAVPADYDGDGKADMAIYRPSTGTWYISQTGNSQVRITAFGTAEDVPVVGDFDGDGKADIAVWRPSTGGWYILQSSNGQAAGYIFGSSDDKPVPADFDGDGKTDIGVYKPATGTWYRINSSSGATVATVFGLAEDLPTAADYDGDGKADVSVWRPSSGIWYVLGSTSGFTAQQFGGNGDKPAPNAFIR